MGPSLLFFILSLFHRSEALLKPCLPFLYQTTNTEVFKILFHNVRSLHLHIKDVSCDDSVKAADINIFVESALCATDSDTSYSLPNVFLYRSDFNPLDITRTPYGTAVYVRNDVACLKHPFRYNDFNTEITVTVVDAPISNLHVIGIYRSTSKVKVSQFLEALRYLHQTILRNPHTPVVILGDFNINLTETSCEERALVRYLFEEKGYTQLIKQFTTDYKSQIDHIYTNIAHRVYSSGTLESYYSDHKPIFICLMSNTNNNANNSEP